MRVGHIRTDPAGTGCNCDVKVAFPRQGQYQCIKVYEITRMTELAPAITTGPLRRKPKIIDPGWPDHEGKALAHLFFSFAHELHRSSNLDVLQGKGSHMPTFPAEEGCVEREHQLHV